MTGSTFTLDYASPLYASIATPPKVMQGASITGISVNSTSDANAVTQLITISYNGTLWQVTGSVSGSMGNFTGDITTGLVPETRNST